MAYSLSTSYVGESLISGFDFQTGRDLSNGFVSYKSQNDALDMGLYSIDADTGAVRLGVDHTKKYATDTGRPSIRLHSKTEYNHGLFIADFLHMPPSQCGVWPAFWAYGSPWPDGGEIDIIEGANMAYSNIISAHTADGCFLDPADTDMFTGKQRNSDCEIGSANVGCGYDPPASDASSYGDGFNAVNGGVYAMLWDSDFIRVWHFARGNIPSDIVDKKPEPEGWGLPQALFGGSKCDVDTYFKNMNIVLNINFCGDYGAATWKNFETCASYADTCVDYVANNPQAFKNAYWDVNYIDVYNYDKSAGPETTATAAPTDSDDSDEETSTTTKTSTTTMTLTITGSLDASGSFNPIATATPAPEPNVPSNPAKIGDYTYLGCFGSQAGFETFDFATESRAMTFEACIEACEGTRYIGLFEGNCYCASKLDADTRAVGSQSACNRPCPGNTSEFCGGFAGASNATSLRFRRDASSTYLLTVYADRNANEPPAQPPAIGPAPSPTATAALTSLAPAAEGSGGRTIDINVDITLTLDPECSCYKTLYLPRPTTTESEESQADALTQADISQADAVTAADATVTVPVVPVEAETTLTIGTSVITKAITITKSEEVSQVEPADIPQETGAADAVEPQGFNQTIPSIPTTTRVFTYNPTKTGEPLYVTAGAYSGWKEVKSSALMCLLVAVFFTVFL